MTADEMAPEEAVPTGGGTRAPRVRPYTITGGRTRTRTTLAVETLVQTASALDIPTAGIPEEQRTICRLCVMPISVAEVSARVDLPLGVTRVVLDDMARGGLVVLHLQASSDDRPSRELLERVLDGLQRL
ncbi:uncharacterized protein DUF742 [Actinomycetospora succinea]|uniref:Uncharacterized protein DUF742 n=1 Tax=Actinomycetospora succinea TaxID=663603 RepID=A0A4R6V672_9PSEU|nr:DUF742 domain-containing protein [Actinomycetospora succinea]TDQ55911.1 uncharacterized protein DUF742 [Actinomycetospora succinea]